MDLGEVVVTGEIGFLDSKSELFRVFLRLPLMLS